MPTSSCSRHAPVPAILRVPARRESFSGPRRRSVEADITPLDSRHSRRRRRSVDAHDRADPHHGALVIGAMAVLVCWAVLVGGCSKKIVKPGVPFDLDKIFATQTSSGKELSKKGRGVRLAKEKLYSQALKEFKAHILEQPEDFSGFNAIAVCYKNLGDQASAIRNYERALEFAVSPADRAKVLANIGYLYFGEKRYQSALGYYREAHSEFEQNPLYLIFIARTLIRLGDDDRARKVLREAEKMKEDLDRYDPDDSRGLSSYLMADCYLSLKDYSKFLDYFDRAIRANPGKYSDWLSENLSREDSPLREIKNGPRLKKILEKYGITVIRSPKRS